MLGLVVEGGANRTYYLIMIHLNNIGAKFMPLSPISTPVSPNTYH